MIDRAGHIRNALGPTDYSPSSALVPVVVDWSQYDGSHKERIEPNRSSGALVPVVVDWSQYDGSHKERIEPNRSSGALVPVVVDWSQYDSNEHSRLVEPSTRVQSIPLLMG